MTTHTAAKPTPPTPPQEDGDEDVGDGIELRDPDTLPDTSTDAEFIEALEWLKKAGIVSQEGRPAFANFFEEVVHTSQEGDPEP